MTTRRSIRPRLGFTLVELMMVITVIGILASLASVAVFRAITTARRAAITVEMDQLTTAMLAFKEQRQMIPPNMGIANLTAAASPTGVILSRQTTFLTAYRTLWPRVTTFVYTTLSNTANIAAYTSTANNARLNIDTLDPSEALVFWLGGMPTPVGASAAYGSRKLYGFHMDPSNPFRLEAANAALALRTANRSTPLFDFNEARLVDQDNDGWWEYVPRASPGPGGRIAPYVYFDAPTYTMMVKRSDTMPFQPFPGTGTTAALAPRSINVSWDTLAADYGYAFPYARAPFPTASTGAVLWMNPTTFQIVSGGLDSQYATPNSNFAAAQRIPAFPSPEWPYPQVASGNVGTAATQFATVVGLYDDEESDNQTNFSGGAVGDASGSSP